MTGYVYGNSWFANYNCDTSNWDNPVTNGGGGCIYTDTGLPPWSGWTADSHGTSIVDYGSFTYAGIFATLGECEAHDPSGDQPPDPTGIPPCPTCPTSEWTSTYNCTTSTWSTPTATGPGADTCPAASDPDAWDLFDQGPTGCTARIMLDVNLTPNAVTAPCTTCETLYDEYVSYYDCVNGGWSTPVIGMAGVSGPVNDYWCIFFGGDTPDYNCEADIYVLAGSGPPANCTLTCPCGPPGGAMPCSPPSSVTITWQGTQQPEPVVMSVPGSHSETSAPIVYINNNSDVNVEVRVTGCLAYGLGCVDCANCDWVLFEAHTENWVAYDYDSSSTWTLETRLA